MMVILLVVLSAAWSVSASEFYEFKLAMSKDKKLCPAITKVLSEEYSRIGIEYAPEHEWFQAIQWQSLVSLGEQFKEDRLFRDEPCRIYRWAKFDLNNDDKSDIIVKWSGCLGGIASDTLYIFSGTETAAEIHKALIDPFTPSDVLMGKIDYTGDTYYLRQLSPYKRKRGSMELHSVAGQFFLHPFVFENATFLNIHGVCCDDSGKAWHVVAKYKQVEKGQRELDDVCYIERLSRKSGKGRK